MVLVLENTENFVSPVFLRGIRVLWSIFWADLMGIPVGVRQEDSELLAAW
jgi:hypothetical protein